MHSFPVRRVSRFVFTLDPSQICKRFHFEFSFIAATQIHRVLTVWIHRTAKLQLVSKTTNTLRHHGDDGNLKMHMLQHMGIDAPPSANYDILVSVFHPRPDQQKVRWDVRAAIDSKNQAHFKRSTIQTIHNFPFCLFFAFVPR